MRLRMTFLLPHADELQSSMQPDKGFGSPPRLPFRPPLRAAFTGLRGVPWLALATNSIAPLLVLDEKHVEYRVIRLRRRAYALITQVDLRLALGTVNVVLTFADTPFTFTANVGTRARARDVLSILAGRGCAFTERAKATFLIRK